MKRAVGIITLLLIYQSFCSGQHPAYRQYTIKDGLPSNYVYCTYQDSKGYIWFGTDAGVSRYNGYEFENFSLEDGLADNDIFEVFEDSKGRLWFRTYNGRLCYFKNGRFHNSSNSTILKEHDFDSYISCIYEDGRGNIWIGTEMDGIAYFDTNDVFYMVPKTPLQNTKSYMPIYSIWEGSSNDIYALTRFGIENISQNEIVSLADLSITYFGGLTHFKCIKLDEENLLLTENENIHVIDSKSFEVRKKTSLLNSTAVFLKINKAGSIIAGTYNGLFTISDVLKEEVNVNHILKGLTVSDCILDTDGNQWYTTLQEGVYFQSKVANLNYTSQNFLPEKRVGSVDGNSSGVVLIGQDSLYSVIDQSIKLTTFHDSPSYEISQVPSTYRQMINHVKLDENGEISVGSNHGLVIRRNNKKYYFVTTTRAITKGMGEDLWIGSKFLTQTTLNELDSSNRFRKETYNNIDYYGLFKIHLNNKEIYSLFWNTYDSALWIGTKNGLMLYKNGNFQNIPFSNDTHKVTVKDIVGSYDKETIWIATDGDGVFKMDTKGNSLLHITKKDGLASNNCETILEDQKGTVWVATNKGLNEIRLKNESISIKKYSSYHGLLADKINDFYLRNDTIWIATDEGLSVMKVNSNDTQRAISTHIVKVKTNGNKVNFNGQNEFDYKQNNISIEYIGLNYDGNEIEYRYNVSEDQTEWNYTSNRTVDFSSLLHDDYTFRVQSRRKGSEWSIEQQASISFTINPPFWKTKWAYTCCFFLGSLFIYAAYRYEVRRQRLKSTLELEKAQSKKIKELEHVKSQFFLNISHEFRTPLTLMLGPLDSIISETNQQVVKNHALMARRNADSLKSLINQLLDISKLESRKLKLHYENKDIIDEISLLAGRFEALAREKEIKFTVEYKVEKIVMKYDPKKLEIIINNLLSNAIKFTSPKGEVGLTVDLNSNGSTLKIEVKDTGIGISEENLINVFKRFYQIYSSTSREHEGTGIGLSLTKELVELHGGNLTLESKENKGSIFIIKIPTRSNSIDSNLSEDTLVKTSQEVPKENLINTDSTLKEKPSILVVEDNTDLQLYISEILKPNYRISLAKNGHEGIEKANKACPDLVISDVMMPKMNGVELCELLKKNRLTSHIPVILLTAKAATESRITGLEVGADDYITKPFNHLELLARIKNLIDQRSELQQIFSRELALKPQDLVVNDMDKQFMRESLQIIEDNMENFDFDVSTFTKTIGMSKTQLHNKIKAITGLSTSEFNRSIRIKRAAMLLQEREYSISEIAQSVGFKDPRYFTKCFKKTFGKLPSHYSSGLNDGLL